MKRIKSNLFKRFSVLLVLCMTLAIVFCSCGQTETLDPSVSPKENSSSDTSSKEEETDSGVFVFPEIEI